MIKNKKFLNFSALILSVTFFCVLSFYGCSNNADLESTKSSLISSSKTNSDSIAQNDTKIENALTSKNSTKSESNLTSQSTVKSESNLTSQDATNSESDKTVKYPAEILDLTNWKLTLPIIDTATNKPAEIKQPELGSFLDENYFSPNSDFSGVVFTAPIDGATTTGSKYPRSELREMTLGGTKNASWDTTNGTHIMTITQAITHTPNVKKHVVVGQIHDENDDVIVFRLEGTKLFIDVNGENKATLDPHYLLGSRFTVMFVAGGDSVMCYYNGKHVLTYNVKASGCYFKAGMYTQSNLSKGDTAGDYGEVEIFALFVEHFTSSPQDASYYETK